jgi:metal-sulfur cluster biosynthetic enzyme
MSDTETPQAERIEHEINEALKTVNDPELGIDIINLGLVYDIDVKESGDAHVQYSLTTMGCPIGPMIEDQIKDVTAPIEGIGEVTCELVFYPPWSPEKMSQLARSALGIV